MLAKLPNNVYPTAGRSMSILKQRFEKRTEHVIGDGSVELKDIAPTEKFDRALVSVIISNHNYAKYLPACVEAVLAQSYENIQCIIVDDASTDGSPYIIDEIAQKNPSLLTHKRAVNGGQNAAVLDGFSRTNGQFVVFLDADDILLPNAIASHVYVHNSLRLPIGFTCADMLQIDGNTFVSSANQALNQFVLGHPKQRFEPRQTLYETVRRPTDVYKDILANIYLLDDRFRTWAWSATSAMMFRRDALNLWAATPGLEELRYSTDAFFCYGINAICGSALIDIPLVGYRIHGKNGFAARLPLNNVRNYEVSSQAERSIEALELLLNAAKANHVFYRGLFWRNKRYRAMLSYLEDCLYNLRRNNLKDRSTLEWVKLLVSHLGAKAESR
jgi:glycosyltransferase involved in cell wall biosynthesis